MSELNKHNVENVQLGIKRGIEEIRDILGDVTDGEVKAALQIELNHYNQ